MKTSSKKILLWLYRPVGEVRWVPVTELKQIIDGQTSHGQKSLLAHLRKAQLLETEIRDSGIWVRLTQYGREELEAIFPALVSQDETVLHSWNVLLFNEPPASDPNFRFLRRYLLEHRWGAFSRGIYLYPGSIPPEVTNTIRSLYRGSVYILAANNWIYGDELSIVSKVFQLQDVKDALSGISSEIQNLLASKKLNLALNYQSKHPVFMVYDRLVEVLAVDNGLVGFYYKDIYTSVELLFQLQDHATRCR